MNLFNAAIWTNQYMPGQTQYVNHFNDTERAVIDSAVNVLESWHYVGKQRYVDEMRAGGAKIFLDSGAFSAHTLGVKMNIDEYCDYIKRNMDILRVEDGDVMASVLDGIGDALKTYQNQIYMERAGAKPLPCFHFGEDERYLDLYVKKYRYITIGGLVGRSSKDAEVWLDRIWQNHMLDGSGNARLKVHAFGVTSPHLMQRYPWFSVDSSSWIQAASFGSIFTSEHGPISISKDSPSRQTMGRHFTTLTNLERAKLSNMLEVKGFNFDRLSEVYQSRASYNILGYIELNKIINDGIEAKGGIFDVCKSMQLF